LDSTTSMFDKKTVNNILIGEFLTCWNWIREDNLDISMDIGDNLYVWKFQLTNLKSEKLKDSTIEFKLYFHERLYPNYPPLIKIISPNLKNSLIHRIANSKMTQLLYWTPARSVKYIVERIIKILEKWGEVDDGKKEIITGNVLKITEYLTKLSSFIDSVDDDVIDKDENFIKCSFSKPIKKTIPKNSTTKYWKSGTGFGHSGAPTWNAEEYVKIQIEKDNNIYQIINFIVVFLQGFNNSTDEFLKVCNVISDSLLLPYLKQQFKQSTLLDIQNREKLFKKHLQLLESLASEKSIYLFDLTHNDSYTLYDALNSMSAVLKESRKFDDNEFINYMDNMLDSIIFPFYEEYKKCNAMGVSNDTIKILTDTDAKKTVKEIYKETMTKFRFSYNEIISTNYHNEYTQLFKSHADANWKFCQKRLSAELPSLKSEGQLPIDHDASIFICIDDNNPMIIRALITGPPDTPYDSGCFIFDIYIPPTYPKDPPNFWFLNHGGYGFNPNLYADGKVCLSILGTYIGPAADKSEMWNEKTSTLLQVLISIQSQILIENPWFNEPSREKSIGTESGKLENRSYNEKIQLYTMTSTIKYLIKNPKMYPQFEDIIRNHFKLKKNYILQMCNNWFKNASKPYKNKYNVIISDIQKYLDEL
jgi:ubiquitin-protein ligase